MDQEAFKRIVSEIPRKVTPTRLWSAIAADLSLVFVMVLLARVLPNWLSWLVNGILFAIVSFRVFSLMHDCSHRASHQREWINNAVGHVYGVFCFFPFPTWREKHLEHHFWTGNIERDPSMKILLEFKKIEFQLPFVMEFCWRGWIPFFGLTQHFPIWQTALDERKYFSLLSSFSYVIVATWLLGPVSVVFGVFCYFLLVEHVNFPQHLGMPLVSGDVRFLTYEQHDFTRTCLFPRFFARFALRDFNLHNEHHLLPSYPWYQLDTIHRRLSEVDVSLQTCEANGWNLLNRRRSLVALVAETFREPKKEHLKRFALNERAHLQERSLRT